MSPNPADALARALAEHARARGAVIPGDTLLRYLDGRPLTSSRYDNLWQRLGAQLPWVATHGSSAHWLRHTDSTGPATTTYIKADLHAVATALAAMTGAPHPLALTSQAPAGPDPWP